MVLLTALIISFTTVDLVSLFIALEPTGFSFPLIADRTMIVHFLMLFSI